MSNNSMEQAASQVQERLMILNKLVRDIESERLNGEKTLLAISKTQDKISLEDRQKPYAQQRLKGLYISAVRDATKAEELLRHALGKINEIRVICNERRLQARNVGHRETFHKGALLKMLHVTAQTLPLWVSKPGTSPPPLCGTIPPDSSYIAKPGDMVAALVENNSGDTEDNLDWILAAVVSFNPTTKKYEVYDIDEEQDLRHTLSRRQVIPLPVMRANPETDAQALFPEGEVIMALYPTTTCFYKAIVIEQPTTPVADYKVIFEDRTLEGGYTSPLNVAQRYAIEYKEKKKAER